MSHLFAISPEDVADTSDDWYTPRWLFDAAGLIFDVDVCAPVNPARRTCPASRYLTVIDDGLMCAWDGLVWCNPPYSDPAPWVSKWISHDGMLLVPAARSRWLGLVMAGAEALSFVSCEFGRPDGSRVAPGGMALVLAARGERSIEALTRVAMADRIAQGSYITRT